MPWLLPEACMFQLLRPSRALRNTAFARTETSLDSAQRRVWRGAIVAALLAGCQILAHAQFSVGANGAPIYTQAIKVPPGAGGLAPSLAIQYDGSYNVDGPLGYGWSVQGYSVITRCAATVATDGNAGSVHNGSDDKLCLDGQRLIRLDGQGNAVVGLGTNDAAGTSGYVEYRTEVDSYQRVRAYGFAKGDSSGASGPAYFRVWTKDGRILDYGASPAADANANALITTTGQPAIAWALARIADVPGNHIDFKYEQRDLAWGSGATASSPTAGHEWNLTEVQYSGNKVIFNFDPNDSRTDKSEAYRQGVKAVTARRITSITAYINTPNTGSLGPASSAVAVTTYRFDPETGQVSGRTRLKAIHECAGGPASTNCQPPVTFNYADGGTPSYAATSAFLQGGLTMQTTANNYGVIVADFNGDGKADFIRWSDNPAENQLYLSKGDGSFATTSKFNITANLFKSDGCYLSMVGDFNGDGLPDIFRYATDISPTGASCGIPATSSVLYLNNGDGSFTPKSVTGLVPSRRISNISHNCDEYSAGGTCISPGSQVGWTAGWTFYIMDVNGDGKLDIVSSNLPGANPADTPVDPCGTVVCTHVYLGDGQGGFTETATNLANQDTYSAPDGFYVVGSPSHVVDLDGDGLADLLAVGNPWVAGGTAHWRSQGNGSFTATSGQGCAYPIDFNGDGNLDCISGNSNPIYNRLQVSTGTANQTVGNFNLTATGQAMGGTGVGIVVADVDGDGRQDIIRWEDNAANNAVFLSNGDGTFRSTPFLPAGVSGSYPLQSSDGSAAFIVADFTGHGNAEILRMQSTNITASNPNGTPNNQLLLKQSSTPLDQLISVTSAAGAKTSLVQVPLSNPYPAAGSGSASLGARYASDLGKQGLAAAFPVIDMSPPAYVVATATTDSGVGSATLSDEYIYYGLKRDTHGRGILGFREIAHQGVGGDGSALTTDTQYLQTQPYIGMPSQIGVYKAAGNALASVPPLRLTKNVYCDQTLTSSNTAGSSVNQAVVNAAESSGQSCATTAKIARPFLLYVTNSGQDLDGTGLPSTSAQILVTPNGGPTDVSITTTGTAAGVNETFTKALHNTYQGDDVSCNADNFTCKWFVDRVAQTTVNSAVPNSLASITTSAGSNPNATATTGHGSLQAGVVDNLTYGTLTVGTSTPQTTTIANDGIATLTLTPPSASSVSGSDFSFVSTDCPTSLAPQAVCHVTVNFAPVNTGTRSGALNISSGAGTLTATLTGTGAAPAVVIVPGWTNWGTVGAASDSGDWLTVKNSSTVSVLLTAHAPVVNPTGTMWSYSTTTAGYCNFGTTVLAPGGSCKTFFGMGAGSVAGSYGATDQVSYQAQGISATFSVQQAYTFAIADTAPSPSSLSFGNVTYQSPSSKTVTLTNSAGVSLDNLAISVGGANASNFSAASSCGSSLAANSTCTITVTFTPQTIANNLVAQITVTGAYSRVTSNGKESYYPNARTMNVGLSGNGYGSIATLTSATTLNEAAAWYGAPSRYVTANYRNDGNAPLSLPAPSLTAPLSATSNCNNIGNGGTCSITITAATNVGGVNQAQSFTPSGATVAPAATTVTWTNYTAVPRWSTTALIFPPAQVGGTYPQSITLYNDGNTTYNWASNNGIANAPAGFSFNTSACSSVAPGGSCNVTVTYSPTALTSYGGTGITMSAASYNTNTFSARTTVIISPTTLNFGSVSSSKGSADLYVSVTNTDIAAATYGVSGVTYTSGSRQVGTISPGGCPAGLAAGATCSLDVTYSTGCTQGPRQGYFGISGANFSAVTINVLASTSVSGPCS